MQCLIIYSSISITYNFTTTSTKKDYNLYELESNITRLYIIIKHISAIEFEISILLAKILTEVNNKNICGSKSSKMTSHFVLIQ